MKWPKIKIKGSHEFTRKQAVYTQYTLFVLLFAVNMQPASLRKNNVIVVVIITPARSIALLAERVKTEK